MQLAILIAIGAGLASAALYASASTGTLLGVFVLFFMSPMPVAIAGLGWGWASGSIAAAVGTIVAAIVGGPRGGIVYLVALGAPAAVFSYLALLNRQVELEADAGNGQAQSAVATEWYPLGRLVAWASLWAGLVAAAALIAIAPDAAGVRAAMLELIEKSRLAEAMGTGGRPLNPQEKNAFVALMAALLPWAIATMWFTIAMLNLWLAGHVTRASGRLIRPWPDLSAISLPPAVPLAFGAAILGTFLADMPGMIASGFASALMFALMLLGLAIMHRITRATALRPAILGTVYAGLLFLQPVSTLLIAMIGLAEPFFRNRTPGAPPSPST
jgi:hypothetical protein